QVGAHRPQADPHARPPMRLPRLPAGRAVPPPRVGGQEEGRAAGQPGDVGERGKVAHAGFVHYRVRRGRQAHEEGQPRGPAAASSPGPVSSASGTRTTAARHRPTQKTPKLPETLLAARFHRAWRKAAARTSAKAAGGIRLSPRHFWRTKLTGKRSPVAAWKY